MTLILADDESLGKLEASKLVCSEMFLLCVYHILGGTAEASF